jgi:eukaryotic-like serine/threonine-protein kinase
VSDPLVGTTVGDYTIEHPLGAGGFATVYAGRDAAGAAVAIKVLLAEHLGGAAVERFSLEISIVRRLQHPNIIDVRGAGVLPDGRPYCVMELLHGRDVATAVAGGALPHAQIVDIVDRLAGALGAAHAANIIHRDVKTTNVFLCDDGRVVLLDFGIAKLAAVGLTQSREAIGTVGAMSPEQLAGRTVDARSDIYALGALLYELATGSAPFRDERNTALEVQAHRFAQRPRPSLRGAPEALDPVIARAMAIRPADRYATAAELADAVRAALGPAAARSRARAIAVHVDALHAPGDLAAATSALAQSGFRPLAAGIVGGAWWRGLEQPEQLARTLANVLAGDLAVTVHVDELELDSGQAVGGPLAELWRWVPVAAPPGLIMTPAARAILTGEP